MRIRCVALCCVLLQLVVGSPVEFEIPFLSFDSTTGPPLVGPVGRFLHQQVLAGKRLLLDGPLSHVI